MRMTICTNEKFKKGYQVVVEVGDESMDIIDFHPYTLEKAMIMAEKALQIINRKENTAIDIKGVLTIERDSLRENAEYDSLSRKMADRLDCD